MTEHTERSSADTQQRTAAQAVLFANRLEKQYRHLRKWARRTGVSCWRLYDKDIPEIPLAVDIYTACRSPVAETAAEELAFLHIALYERPYDKPDEEEQRWLDAMREAAADVLAIPQERIVTKFRKKQRGESQYEKLSSGGERITVCEGGSQFLVNLNDYLDTGIFLDHRPARAMVRAEAAGKDVLNLFCYTGAFSVHAAAGGARSVTSVDLSKTYLAWAADNLVLNGFNTRAPGPGERSALCSPDEKKAAESWPLVHADVKAFLAEARRMKRSWDLIICDPPTFSNSSRASDILDINRDWAELCRSCLAVLNGGGTLYFSTNSRSLQFDPDLIGGAAVRPGTVIRDLSAESVPEDFRNKKIHRLWKITLG